MARKKEDLPTYSKEDLIAYADYIIDNKTSIKATAIEFNTSENRVYKYIVRYLEQEDSSRYSEIKKILNVNKVELKDKSFISQNGLGNEMANTIIDLLKKYASKENGMVYRNEVMENLRIETKLSKSTVAKYIATMTKDGKIKIISIYGNLSNIVINDEMGYYK